MSVGLLAAVYSTKAAPLLVIPSAAVQLYAASAADPQYESSQAIFESASKNDELPGKLARIAERVQR